MSSGPIGRREAGVTSIFSRAEERLIASLERLLGWEIPPGVGWAHTLGTAAQTALALQAFTGFLLALYYSPSTDTAWESVRHVQQQVAAGAFVRGLHVWGASGLVVLVLLHLSRVFLWGAYKPPRHWTWLVGSLIFLSILAAAFTGSLLPWDIRAYFATRVGAEIAGSVPVVGGPSRLLLLGGERLGNLTLTRFYAIHAILLPILLLVLVATHVCLVRRHGIAPTWFASSQAPRGRFFPDHAWKDAAAGLAVTAILSLLSIGVGAPLGDKADPALTGYVPRPEWYFLPLFQLLRYFEGPLSFLASAVIPALAVLALVLVPWLDSGPETHPAKRKPILLLGAAAAIAVLFLLTRALIETPPPSPPAAKPPSRPPIAVAKTAPEAVSAERGKGLYAALACARCHEGTARVGPDFTWVGSRLTESWLREYLRSPRRLRWKDVDVRPLERMPDFGLTESESADLAAFLASRQDPKRFPPAQGRSADKLVADGRRWFEDYKCLGCHRLEGRGANYGPDLTGAARKYHHAYLQVFLTDPDAILPGNPMKKLELWPEEVTALTAYLETLQTGGIK